MWFAALYIYNIHIYNIHIEYIRVCVYKERKVEDNMSDLKR